jgi:S-DNA-T family DNA segregation ATPase FtsK/SpoIIIE
VEAPPITDEVDEIPDEAPPEPDRFVPEPEEPAEFRPAREAVEPEELTPQGRYRASVTDDPSFVWRVPSARFLVRSTGEAARPDTAGQEQVAATLIETLGHFGIQAKVIGRVTGPHITRYELRLAPGTKVSKVAQLKDDLAYALASRSGFSRRSPGSRRWESRSRTPAAGSCTSATCSRIRRPTGRR